MRGQIAGLVLCIAATAVFAEDHAVLNEEDVWKLYTTPQVSFTDLGGDSAIFVGAGIGTILNDHWYFGVRGIILADDVGSQDTTGDFGISQWDMWDAGGEIGYIFRPDKLLHFDTSLYLGGGQADINTGFGQSESSGFTDIEPQLSFAINLHETWELGVGVGYRFIQGLDVAGTEDDDFSDFTWRVFARATEF